ncbi:bifunctional proline dehydrogenase/L-glutamate gamma-semialdehyde dehydrogenase PutA [Rhodovibrio salinarum]|uniref:Bifunctional protein PutA n=2 Tax=Rhodovibrio salinarum TaxID=1087 RepID=A0A934QG84_9PROT|nr:bifunctional proline dehydrogenase/L-glutamate gamma-semialdehyde dehydrogenase PutA [Rhodovibrio salinarum]
MIFKTPLPDRGDLRARIDAHYRGDETACITTLLAALEDLPEGSQRTIQSYAHQLVEAVRAETAHQGGIDAFLHEYGLSTQEGVLLMCVAEALLRVPDDETREWLIRDKLGTADWRQHLGHSRSLFVNASTWALMMTGRVVRMADARGQGPEQALRRLVARLGEPVVRESVNQAMRIMGRQFVMGRTIEGALERAHAWQKRGYSYSYDMLGEAARTMADARRYFDHYKHAIQQIGQQAEGKGPINGPGISVKLSALHPRYEVANHDRVMDELMPRLRALCVEAARYDIGLNIDAEEADRLDISLDCIEAISGDPDLKSWQGFGVVVQAYQKRAYYVLDYLADMARRHERRLMVRLVKGAYWDMEIKRAQEQGVSDYPVFTRKTNTDVAYLACARKLFANTDAFYPQLATHNAHSIASVLEFAGNSRDFEFQRLHGMGEELYERVIEHDQVGAGCRIYAPVGQHEDLLAYLVRRLLENGANSSFVNRIQDDSLPIEEIVADPVRAVRGLSRVPHPRIPLPRDIYGANRVNAQGVDLSDRVQLDSLGQEMEQVLAERWTSGPIVGGDDAAGQDGREVSMPHDRARTLGEATEATDDQIERAIATAQKAAADWAAKPVVERAACLERAADLMEQEMSSLLGLVVAEVGKTLNDAVSEVREAIDFCRYYALQARQNLSGEFRVRAPAGSGEKIAMQGGGVFTCISPWNLPFAIFNGQVVAALAAGNAVLAKPAEQSPLIAARAVRLLHRAGIPPEVLHLLPGDGARVGGALTRDPRIAGVCFTGSTETARRINRTLAARDGAAIPSLIAETGGQNAMIVDSTALTEQVARDVIVSAFQNAGQRCSALRVLYVQEDVAERTLDMIAGAMDELRVGNPQLLSTDVGPVIDDDAQAMVDQHIKRMLGEAKEIRRARLGQGTENGSFVTPAAFEIDRIGRLEREVFGPVLHVVRYQADRLDQVVDEINATGYGLTMGVHSRIDEMWKRVYDRARVGNCYVNRNQIGAIVGVQPFGGQGLSGTGPKAGGPLYLERFVAEAPQDGAASPTSQEAGQAVDLKAPRLARKALEQALKTLDKQGHEWLRPAADRAAMLERAAAAIEAGAKPLQKLGKAAGDAQAGADFLRVYAAQAAEELAEPKQMPGPTGERNELSFWPRGTVACLALGGDGTASQVSALIAQAGAALAAGNTALLWAEADGAAAAVAKVLQEAGVPDYAVQAVEPGKDAGLDALLTAEPVHATAIASDRASAAAVNALLAELDGPIRTLIRFRPTPADAGAGDLGQPVASSPAYLHRFVHERSLSIDTTASGGNASLLSIEEGPQLPGQVAAE